MSNNTNAMGNTSMNITQETALMIESLSRSAAQLSGTFNCNVAHEKISGTIASLLSGEVRMDLQVDGGEPCESIEEALRADNEMLQRELASLQISARIMAANLHTLRGRMTELTKQANDLIKTGPNLELMNFIGKVLALASSNLDEPAA